MQFMRLRLITVSMIIYFVAGPTIFSQTSENQVILEARIAGTGMSWIQGKHLLAKVYIDGKIEYEDLKEDGRSDEFYIKVGKLSQENIERLRAFLNSGSVAHLPKKVPSVTPTIDHIEEIFVTIYRDDGAQTVSVINFSPNSKKAREAYSPELLRLMCWIEHARKNAILKAFGDETEWCRL